MWGHVGFWLVVEVEHVPIPTFLNAVFVSLALTDEPEAERIVDCRMNIAAGPGITNTV